MKKERNSKREERMEGGKKRNEWKGQTRKERVRERS